MSLTYRFVPVFIYVLDCLRSFELQQPGFDEVQGTVMRLLAEGESSVSAACREEFDLARFAVCAWVDEAVAASSWEHRDLWLKQQLQRVYYNTAAAGAEFFERLSALTPAQRETREIYYLCLVLGFTGRFCNPGDQRRLEELKSANLTVLLSKPGIEALDRGEFFPDPGGAPLGGQISVSQNQRRYFSAGTALCLIAPPVAFGLLFLVYRFILTSIGESLLQGVPN